MRSLVTLAKLAVSMMVLNVAVVGCYAVSPAAGGEAPNGAVAANGAGVDEAVERYVTAVNSDDLDGIVGSFPPDGLIVDVGREIRGADAIRRWADNEVIGGRLEVLERHPRDGGIDLLVRFAPGGTGGFRAWYRFDVDDGLISRADLTYA
jgi:hypothetical protein